MTGETIFIFFIAIVLLWIKPGPGQALRITTTLNDNFMAGFAISMGVVVTCNIFLLIAILGASLMANILGDVSLFFKIFGGFYLIYLGVKGFSPNNNEEEPDEKFNKKKFLKYFSFGLLVALSNPIDIFFFAGILPSLVDIATLTMQDIIIAMAVMTATALMIDALILTLVTQSKTILLESRFAQFLHKITSIGFVLIGLFFLYTAFIGSNAAYETL